MVKADANIRVQVVARPDQQMTGLRRYSEAIVQGLREQGAIVRLHHPAPPVPAVVLRTGRRIGWDLDAFLRSYPVRTRLESADIYHFAAENLASLLVFQRVRPCVVTVHGFFGYLLRDDPTLSMYNHRLDRWFDSVAARGLRAAQAIIAVSSYVRDVLVEKVGIAPSRIRVIPEAVDHAFFRPQPVPEAFRENYGLNKDFRYILYVGSEQPRKNFLTLLRAFARLRQEVRDVRLVKVGQPEVGTERQKALDLIRATGLQSEVLFFQHARQELPLFYNVADLFVFPSLYEGFGFPPLEAMACGTPVVCSNGTSLTEVVGEGGLLFDPMDEDRLVHLMKMMLAHEDLRAEYRALGIERAHDFRWDISARKTLEIYGDVVRSG